jgi:mannose/fructose/N-acetylgalactosamine-specific phosphotransferase system component IIC
MKDVIGTLVRDLSRRAALGPGLGPQAALIAAGLVAVAGFAALQPIMPSETLIPFLATLFFLMACLTLHFALREEAGSRSSAPLTYWDVSGLLTFAGICVATLIEPEGLVRLVTADNRSE